MTKKAPASAKSAAAQAEILSYRHAERRKNNPEVGMVTPATDADDGKTIWQHDPHLDPSLSWTGKAERLSFEVDTVSLHVHERIDPASILSALRRKAGAGDTAKDKAKGARAAQLKAIQPGLFDAPFESLPLRDAIDFYKHDKGWSNRLVAGDSLLVMNSLLRPGRCR
jgi:adenine-specific DNA-methyltransferase